MKMVLEDQAIVVWKVLINFTPLMQIPIYFLIMIY